MSGFSAHVADVTGIDEDRLEPLTGESLSEVLLVRRAEGSVSVA